MKDRITQTLGGLLLAMTFACSVVAEDTDIFASGLQSSTTAPRILVVLDNTSNWARQSQQWPDRRVCPDLSEWSDETGFPYSESECPLIQEQQGQAEVAALKAALADTKDLAASNGFAPNIGILEFTTGGTATQDGGYVRIHMSEYDTAQEALFNATLEEIHAEINDPVEKRNSNTAYGNLMYDIYNYLSGETQVFSGQGTPTGTDSNGNSYPDSRAYTTPYSVFKSPLDDGDVCAETFVIFISNPNQSGPATDSDANSTALKSLYSAAGASPAALAGDSTGSGLQMPEFIEVKGSGGGTASVGFTNACFTTAKKCTQAINGLAGESQAITDACPAGGVCQCTDVGKQTNSADGTACPKANGNKDTFSYDVLAPAAGSDGNYFQSGDVVDGTDFNMDDWTKFLHDYGVDITVDETTGETANMKVSTFTIDVYNKAPDTEHSALMASAANVGGGYRLKAGNYAELKNALTQILSDILAVNTSFAAVSLPLSATNRTQSENKVFVGMFRPAQNRKPRWFGNLKQYQLAIFDSTIALADANLNQAINSVTGFADACAESFWTESTSAVTISQDGGTTTETGGYFTYLDSFDPAPEGECIDSSESPWSDLPDGAFVEKGGVAQQVRLYQQTAGESTRPIFTLSDTTSLSRVELSPNSSGAPSSIGTNELAYLLGEVPGLSGGDTIEDDAGNQIAPVADPQVMPENGLAATVHGDVVHSTPLSISYGPDSGGDNVVRIFYGANDGLYRSIDPDDGREDWAFIPRQRLDAMTRLYENTPAVRYTNTNLSALNVVDEPKDYFLDGNTGFYTTYNSSDQLTTGYIYPTMRRGGRMIYAFNICNGCLGVPPTLPTPMWSAGCSNDAVPVCSDGLGNNATELADLGQTWSTPLVIRVNGYTNPVLFMGGGWSDCLDADTADLGSACSKDTDLTDAVGGEVGSAVYAFDAVTGALLEKWETETPVVSSVVAADLVGEDGVADVAYALDVGGSIYRFAFVTASGDILSAASTTDADGDGVPDAWTAAKIAGTTATDSDRLRFMNTPAVAPVGTSGQKYVFLSFGAGDREKPLKTNYPYDTGITYKFFTVIDRVFEWNVPNDSVGTALSLTNSDRVIDLDDLAPAPGTANDKNTFGLFEVTESSSFQSGDSIANYDGWVFSLSTAGEQIVNPAAISGGRVFFNSYNPSGEGAACSALGSARGYSLPLFSPAFDAGRDIEGGGIPIPPIIATVQLDENAACVGDECDEESREPQVVTVCIGCEGFEPLPVEPTPGNTLREIYRIENTDLQ